MKEVLRNTEVTDFEALGYHTRLACEDADRARAICGLHLHAYAENLQPQLSRLRTEIAHNKTHAAALHHRLYSGPTPINDAASRITSSLEIAKRRCMAGILRAENVRAKPRVPYYRGLTVFALFAFVAAHGAHAQDIDRYEGILIDTSGSISHNGTATELFREYLLATRKLLLTEPPKSRVWISTIATDSFGGVRELLKGWTPDAQGVFTMDLTRARRELAAAFESKSATLSPTARATDIIGGLWHLKTLFESNLRAGQTVKAIWIFSDMMNETEKLPMPALIGLGAERMMEHVNANGLLVPLNGYKVYVYGASPAGLSPQAWETVKKFWNLYFSAAGAELVFYSAECNVER